MKKIIFVFLLVAIFSSCREQTSVASVDELYAVEKAFSKMSAEKGMIEAFTYYCDDDGAMLRNDSYPIVGKDAVVAELSTAEDTRFSLTWEVIYAAIAASGDLGYTYGTFLLDYHDEDLEDNKGTYVTIWKKNEAGQWRFVMDTGQDGLGE